MNILFALLSGLLLFITFPPFNLFFIAWFALIPLLIAVKRAKTAKEAFLGGFLCGLVFFGGMLFWVNALMQWAGAWAVIGFAVLVILQALFIGAFSFVAFHIIHHKFKSEIVVLALFWAVVEWLRSIGPFGVTGGDLAYSQIGFLAAAQIARIFGVFGVSFLIMVVNSLLFQLFVEEGKWLDRIKAKKVEISAVLLVFLAVIIYGGVRMNRDFKFPNKVKVAVIQAAIPQDIKLDFGQVWAIVDLHKILSLKIVSEKPDIIIWPETAVTTYLNLAPNVQREIEQLVQDSKASYLIGTSHTTGGKNYNSVVAFYPDGKMAGRYNKQRPVPFGEYLPLRFILYPILKGINLLAEDYHSDPSGNIIDLGNVKVGVVICFESTFPHLVRNKVKKGADVIVVVTNDAWFGGSAALAQHLQSSRMRAIENGVYVVQAANTGISAIIDPAGRVIERTGVDEEVIMLQDVYFQ
ncbi:apolipoprotein N-acyltransferase [Candidatus Margulisiibacteriota bacterium]